MKVIIQLDDNEEKILSELSFGLQSLKTTLEIIQKTAANVSKGDSSNFDFKTKEDFARHIEVALGIPISYIDKLEKDKEELLSNVSLK